ncbi:MAG: hypothetical protein ACFCVH_08095 [Alphaproteobacteria bacterium]
MRITRIPTRSATTGAAMAAALALASCVDSGGGTAPLLSAAGTTGPAPGAPAAASAADIQLRNLVAAHSIHGTNVAGEPFCTYYADNGEAVRVIAGEPPQIGSWSISNARVCESLGGYSWCSQFAFDAPSFTTVTITPLEGSGTFPYTASVAAGSACQPDRSWTPEDDYRFSCVVNGPEWCEND